MKLLNALALAVCLCMASVAYADVRLANIFNDHMVLQQGKPISIWGRADSGAEVTVILTESLSEARAKAGAEALKREAPEKDISPEAQYKVRIEYIEQGAPKFTTIEKKARADKSGRWSVQIGALNAGFAPKFLLAVAAKQAVAVKNIVVGEVWVCAGQSNMFYPGNKTGWLDSEGLLAPGVRYAHTGRASSYKAKDDLAEPAVWKECTAENLKGISTIPYLFGKFLHRRLQVPVGVINAASGGAQGNYWCSMDELHKIDLPEFKEIMAEHDQALAAWEDPKSRKKILDAYEKEYAAQLAAWTKEAAKAKADKKRPPRKPEHRPPGSPRSKYLTSYLFNARIAPIGKLAVRGILYLQGEQQVLTWSWSQYKYTFPAVLRSFRTAFGDRKLPFGIITLQGAAHTKGNLGEISSIDRTSIVRDIHYRTHLAASNTGFICAHDVGLGLHPSWKRPVAERAVHWALRDVYKVIDSEHMSVKTVEFSKGKAAAHIQRDHAQRKRDRKTKAVTLTYKQSPARFSRYTSSDTFPFDGFIIAGADRRWYPAKIKIDTKQQGVLEVSSDLVDNPVAVRYGWGSYPHANIGYWHDPLPPFRTDDWPLGESFGHKPELKQKARSRWYRQLGERFADMLDRTIRQGQIDAAISELKLYGEATAVLQSKARRMEAILDELKPAFFRSEKLLWADDRDWTILRVDGPRLKKAAAVPDQMAELVKKKEIVESVKNLRKALEQFRKAVGKP